MTSKRNTKVLKPKLQIAQRKKAVAALRKGKTFFLSGHVRPDGDCLGSALALELALERLGKRAEVYSRDPIPQTLSFLPGADQVHVGRKPEEVFDVAVFLECSSPLRSGGLIDLDKQAKLVVNLDSHLRTEPYGDINVIEPDISSTAEQVDGLISMLGVKVDKKIATCLYAGLATDTGRFHYSNTTPDALRFAARLIETGIDAPGMNDRLFATHPLPALKLLARALNGLRLENGGRIAVQSLTNDDFRVAEALPEHTEDIVNFGMAVPGVEVSVILKDEKQGIRCSLRSRGHVDVSRIAAAFGGGGHHNASGCTLHGELGEAERRLVSEIKKNLS
jgi:phosphoesterase RecJ-like protein